MKNEKLRIIGIILLLVVQVYSYESNTITSNELKQLKVLDKEIYRLSVQNKNIDFVQVVQYIFRNLSYDVKYNRLKINASARARLNDTDTTMTNYIGVNLSYVIFDKKESNTRQKEFINIKNSITKDIKNYFKIKTQLQELQTQDLILKYLEIRDKTRKIDGVGGFSDWLKTIKEIKKNKYNISFKTLELIEAKQILLNYIKPNATKRLKELLK